MHILAPASATLTFLVLWAILLNAQANWRSSFLSASIIWATYLVAVTEILSLLTAISFRTVLLAWAMGLLIALGWVAITSRKIQTPFIGLRIPALSALEYGMLAGCALIAGLTALTAWIAPPNTIDSMTYHMPRVMHWIQQQSVRFYPTNKLAQLYLAPGAEYIILHFQILAGSDRLANFVGWFSMIGSALGVSLIASEFGCSRRAQILGALVTMTIPSGILQASGTQNNYLTAFWLASFLYWMMLLRQKGDFPSAALSAGSLGLAALTKAIAYVFALPFLMWLAWSLLRAHRQKSVYVIAATALIFLLINLGTYVRNYGLFGNPVGIAKEVSIQHPQTDFTFSNDMFSLAQLSSSLVRNASLHMSTPSDQANAVLVTSIRSLHAIIGLPADDPRTTWAGDEFGLYRLSFDENTDGNSIHLALGCLSAVLLLRRRPRRNGIVLYAICLLSAFLVFCLYLKWQPFHSRLHLPLFVLWSPVVAVVSDGVDRRWFVPAVSVLLLVASLPWALLNRSRPLIGDKNIFNASRNSLYFFGQPERFKQSYLLGTQFVARVSDRQCRQIGIYLDHGDWEYPFWVLLEQRLGRPVSIESVEVRNISSRTSRSSSELSPCAVFVANPLPLPGESVQVDGKSYERAWRSEAVSVFLPSGAAAVQP